MMISANRIALLLATGLSLLSSVAFALPGDLQAEVLADGLEFPVKMATIGDGDILVTEKLGKVRLIRDGRLLDDPVARFDVKAQNEAGLLDVVTMPDFDESGEFLVSYTPQEELESISITRLRLEGDSATIVDDPWIELPSIASTDRHFGGTMTFDSEGHLYISLGDLRADHRAQDQDDLPGSILRYDLDGAAAEGNPFGDDNAVYAYGFRNPFGIFSDGDDRLVIVENSGLVGDEINLIEAGGNYGWPIVEGYCDNFPIFESCEDRDMLSDPIHEFRTTIGSTAIVRYQGEMIDVFENELFVTGWHSRSIHHLEWSDTEERAIPLGILFEAPNSGAGFTDLVVDDDGAMLVLESSASSGVVYRIAGEEFIDNPDSVVGNEGDGCSQTGSKWPPLGSVLMLVGVLALIRRRRTVRLPVFVLLSGLLLGVGCADSEDATNVDNDWEFEEPNGVKEPPEPVECDDVDGELSVGDSVSATLPSGVGEIDETSCATSSGMEHTYSLYVPERTDLKIWTSWENSETDFSPVLTLVEGCDGDEELACSNPLASKPDGLNGLIRTTLSAGTYLLRIDERNNVGFGDGGDYKIHTEAVDLAANSRCEDALLLEPGQDPVDVTETDGSVFGEQAACFGEVNHVLFYAVDVPPQHTAHATASHIYSDDAPWVRMGSSCESDDCDLSFGGAGGASLSNTTDEEVRYFIAVSNSRELPYAIKVDVVPMAQNASCDGAVSLTPGAPAQTVDWSQGLANTPSCNGDRRNKLFYKVDVPANHRLFTYGEGASYGPSVVFRDSCDASSCLDRNYVNESGGEEEIILEATGEGIGTSALRAEVVELVDHASCATPQFVEIGESRIGESIRTGGEAFNICDLVLTTGVFTLFYRIEIPLGSPGPVTVRAESQDPENLSISLQAFSLNDAASCEELPQDPACHSFDDEYFRPTSDAEITVSPSIGGGRDPAPAIIAVTMSPASASSTEGRFDLIVESHE